MHNSHFVKIMKVFFFAAVATTKLLSWEWPFLRHCREEARLTKWGDGCVVLVRGWIRPSLCAKAVRTSVFSGHPPRTSLKIAYLQTCWNEIITWSFRYIHYNTYSCIQLYSGGIQYVVVHVHRAVIPKSHGGHHFRPKLSSPGFEVCALAFIAGTTEAVYSLVEHEASVLYAFLK